jgi:hypothetical protein
MAPWHLLLLLLILAFWIAPVAVGAVIGGNKGHQALGVVLGLLLGWIGVIIIALVRPAQQPGWPPQQYPGWPPQPGGPYGQQPWPPQQGPGWQPPPYGQQPPNAP